MRIEQTEIDSWIQPLTGKKGDRWPEQRTFHALLRGGELHRFESDAHVLVGRSASDPDAHLITTTSLLEEELSADEVKFIKELLASWSPPTVWLAWLQRDTRMQGLHPALLVSSGLSKVTRKKIRGWAISVGVKQDDLKALIRG